MPDGNATDEIESLLPALAPGMFVQIDSEDNKFKYMAYLVGVDENRTLITQLPTAKQLNRLDLIYEDLLPVHHKVVMRLVQEGIVYAFRTEVLGLMYKPSRLLFTSYPTDIQTRVLRKDHRYPCTLPATIKGLDGFLTNVSHGGCQFQFPLTENAVGTLTPSDDKLALTIRFPYDSNASGLNVTIKSVREEKELGVVGLAIEGDSSAIDKYMDSLQLEALAGFL